MSRFLVLSCFQTFSSNFFVVARVVYQTPPDKPSITEKGDKPGEVLSYPYERQDKEAEFTKNKMGLYRLAESNVNNANPAVANAAQEGLKVIHEKPENLSLAEIQRNIDRYRQIIRYFDSIAALEKRRYLLHVPRDERIQNCVNDAQNYFAEVRKTYPNLSYPTVAQLVGMEAEMKKDFNDTILSQTEVLRKPINVTLNEFVSNPSLTSRKSALDTAENLLSYKLPDLKTEIFNATLFHKSRVAAVVSIDCAQKMDSSQEAIDITEKKAVDFIKNAPNQEKITIGTELIHRLAQEAKQMIGSHLSNPEDRVKRALIISGYSDRVNLITSRLLNNADVLDDAFVIGSIVSNTLTLTNTPKDKYVKGLEQGVLIRENQLNSGLKGATVSTRSDVNLRAEGTWLAMTVLPIGTPVKIIDSTVYANSMNTAEFVKVEVDGAVGYVAKSELNLFSGKQQKVKLDEEQIRKDERAGA